MSAKDLNSSGHPRNTFKRDYNFYANLPGSGGAGAAAITGVTRKSFWVDHNPFATKIRQLISANNDFEIFGAATPNGFGGYTPTPGSEVPVYIRIDQSNDAPDGIIRNLSDKQNLYIDPAILQPPYYITTNFLTQPVDFNYINDQGRYAYFGYTGNGFNLGYTGSHQGILQPFVPTSPALAALWLRRLFHVGSNTDHTRYEPLTVSIYDASMNKVADIATISPLYGTTAAPIIRTDGGPAVTGWGTVYFQAADDALNYWIDIDQIQLKPVTPIKLTVGATYYILIRQANVYADVRYAVGSNLPSGGSPDPNTAYIFGTPSIALISGGTVTVGAGLGTNTAVCFVTQRSQGRTAYTFLWADPNYFWYPPDARSDVFRQLSESFDEVI